MPRLKFDGDARGGMKALADLTDAQDKLRKGGKETEEQFKKTGGSLASAARQALGPQQKYNQKVKELAVLVEKGKISQRTATAAAERYRQTLQRTDPEIKKNVESQKKLTAEAKKIVASGERPAEKYKRQMLLLGKALRSGAIDQKQFVRGARQLRAELKQAESQGIKFEEVQSRTFGAQAIGKLASYATGVFSIGTAVSAVRGLFTKLEEQAQASADRVSGSLDQIGQLQQLADSPEKLAFARRLRSAGVARDLSQAADITFQTGSAGLTEAEREFLAFDVAGNKAIAPADLAVFAAKAKKTQNTLGFSSFRNTTQKLTQTSEATDANITQVAEATTKFGSELSALGFSGDAGLAALATINKKAENIDTAGTRLRSLLVQIDKRGLSEGTLEDTVLAIEGRVQKGENAFDILGETRAVSGFRNIKNQLEGFRSQRDLIASAPARDVVGSRFSQFLKDSQFASALDLEKSTGSLEVIENATFATPENLFNSIRKQNVERQVRKGNRISAVLEDFGFGFQDFIGNERSTLVGAVDDENIRTETRLLIAQHLRETVDQGLGLGSTEQDRERIVERYDKMIELLSKQVSISERKQSQTITLRSEE